MLDETHTDEQPDERQIVDAAHAQGAREGDFVLLVTVQQKYEGLCTKEIEKYAKIAQRHEQVFGVVHRALFTVGKTHRLTGRLIQVPYVRLAIQMPAFVGEKGKIVAHFERAEDETSFYTHLFDETRRAEAEAYQGKLGICEHCNTKRYRKNVFVCDTDEGIKIVGSDCLKDYLGIDPIWQMQALRFVKFATVGEGDWEDRFYGGRDTTLDTDQLVRQCYRVAKKFGGYSKAASAEMRNVLWVLLNGVGTWGSDYERAERQKIWDAYNDAQGAWVFDPEFDVHAFVDYVENMQSDFGANLRVACFQERVEEKRANIVLAGVGIFVGKLAQSLKEKNVRAELPVAKLADGEVGARIERVGTILRTTPYTGQMYSGTVIVIRCESGENLINFHTGNGVPETGRRYTIRGTIKKHGADKRSGEPQTTISRTIYKDAPQQGRLF